MLEKEDLVAAERALSSVRSERVGLREMTEFRPGRVARCLVEQGQTHENETVIVKGPDRAKAPALGWGPFEAECAALKVLDDVGARSTAQLLAVDAASRVLVLEDLGDSPSLAHVLLYSQRPAAEAALIASARALGRLHSATFGNTETYDVVRSRLGPFDPVAERFTLRGRDVRRSIVKLAPLLDTHQLPAVSATADLEVVLDELADPGDFLVLTTGDPCPGNEAVLPSEVRYFDLEAAAPRHALLDVAHYVVPFPNCWCWRRLPQDIAEQMLEAHREEFARTSPAGSDVDRYRSALVRVTAAWIVWTLERRLPAAEQDVDVQARIVEALENFSRFAKDQQELTSLAEDCDKIVVTLRDRWPAASPADYPALGGPPWFVMTR